MRRPYLSQVNPTCQPQWMHGGPGHAVLMAPITALSPGVAAIRLYATALLSIGLVLASAMAARTAPLRRPAGGAVVRDRW